MWYMITAISLGVSLYVGYRLGCYLDKKIE